MQQPWSVVRATAVGIVLTLVYGLISADYDPSGFRTISIAREFGQLVGAAMIGALIAACVTVLRNRIVAVKQRVAHKIRKLGR